MEHITVRELLEARALEALDRRETHLVDEHVSSCPECRDLLEAYRNAATVLTEAVVELAPAKAPTALKSDLMARVEGRGSFLRRLFAPRQRAILRPQAVIAALLLIVVVSSLAWGLNQTSALARERSLRAELEYVAQQQEIIFEIVDSNRTAKFLLRATESGSTTYGKLYTRPDMSHVVALAGRLPPPPEGEAYSLWLTEGGREFFAGTMPINDNGFALALFEAEATGPVYDSARVILQAEGADGPIGRTVLRWDAAR